MIRIVVFWEARREVRSENDARDGRYAALDGQTDRQTPFGRNLRWGHT